MVTKEDFFVAVELAIGPPPVNRATLSTGTMVGGKKMAPAAPVPPPRKIQEMGFKLKLIEFYAATSSTFMPSPIYDRLYEEYCTWHRTQQQIRAAAEKL